MVLALTLLLRERSLKISSGVGNPGGGDDIILCPERGFSGNDDPSSSHFSGPAPSEDIEGPTAVGAAEDVGDLDPEASASPSDDILTEFGCVDHTIKPLPVNLVKFLRN